MTTSPQRILVCGHRSFAATGLVEQLRERGHSVLGFTRGPVAIAGSTVSGPVDQVHQNPHLGGPFDVLINYILLKDESIERNNDYLASLLELCRRTGVKHLVHISSISSFNGKATLITENTLAETNPARKGSYGSLKVATDQYLLEKAPADLAMTFFRPGFILGPGVTDPIVGMGVRIPGNRIMLLGSAANHVPVTTRKLVSEAVARCAEQEPRSKRGVLLLADTRSPTRKQFLQGCCDLLGAGTGVVSAPVWMWWCAGLGGEAVSRVLGMGIRPLKVVGGICRTQRFDSSVTARTLAMDLSVDWKKELVDSLDNQRPDWEPPHRPTPATLPAGVRRVNIVGFGGIVKQKHLPALKKLGFAGEIAGYDVAARADAASGLQIQALDGRPLPGADLHVIASPGPVHNRAIALLRGVPGPILVEKPVCYTEPDLEEWLAFDAERGGGVSVLHNYRFKSNVTQMLEHLARYNPGRLHRVDVHFQSPSVGKDVAWRRDERRARTLLMDYALHFLDLACMFDSTRWEVESARHQVNTLAQTGLIEGQLRSSRYTVAFMLRQGFMPRRARIFYTFENYCVSLGFFPDTFVAHMGPDNWKLHKAESRASLRSAARKVADKLTNRDSDLSHALAFSGALGNAGLAPSLELRRLENFYRAVFGVAERVYGS